MEIYCKQCSLKLSGRKRIFCSLKCTRSHYNENKSEKRKKYLKDYWAKRRKPSIIKKIFCEGCDLPIIKTSRNHRFCDKCSHKRKSDIKIRYAINNKEKQHQYYLSNKTKWVYKPKEKKYFTCKCGKTLEKKGPQKYCPECRKKINVIMARRWAKNNPDKRAAIVHRNKNNKRKRTKEQRIATYQKHKDVIAFKSLKKRTLLDDSYIKHSLLHFGITADMATKSLIELQREQLKLKRKTYEKQRNATNIK